MEKKKRNAKKRAIREFPPGWQTEKRRQQALRYFELFLAEQRVPAAMSYQQVRWTHKEADKVLRTPSLELYRKPKNDWDGTLQFERQMRNDARGQYLHMLRALCLSGATQLVFTLDQAFELLRSDLGCEKANLIGRTKLTEDVSVLEALRAGANYARHAHGSKEDSWSVATLTKIDALPGAPGQLGALEEMIASMPFRTWFEFDRALCRDAKALAKQFITPDDK